MSSAIKYRHVSFGNVYQSGLIEQWWNTRQVAELSRNQTAAIIKMEAALVALKEAITELHPEPARGRRDDAAQ